MSVLRYVFAHCCSEGNRRLHSPVSICNSAKVEPIQERHPIETLDGAGTHGLCVRLSLGRPASSLACSVTAM